MPMEEYLATLGLWRKPIAKDGSCLFRAVSEQVMTSFYPTNIATCQFMSSCGANIEACISVSCLYWPCLGRYDLRMLTRPRINGRPDEPRGRTPKSERVGLLVAAQRL